MIDKAMKYAMKLHSCSRSRRVVFLIEALVKRLIAAPKGSLAGAVWESCRSEALAETLALPIAEKFFADPEAFFKSMAIVLKKKTDQEKGVILIGYNYAFPLFLALFDASRAMESYHIVLEPSWTGYCESSILSFAGMTDPVFVESLEPKDSGLLESLTDNLIPVELGANWWVDHRVFHPCTDVQKDVDVCMVASWARFKRHEEVFDIIAKLKADGRELSMMLIGYPIDMTKEDVYQKGKERGIEKQISLFENISQDQVARLIPRSKVNLVWSKREGVNRAIIEGFMCGVPGILREGFNYGHRYRYINSQTGMFSAPKRLGENLLHVIDNHALYSPREWAVNNMSCHQACRILSETIANNCKKKGEPFSGPLFPKINGLGGMQYFD